MFLKPTTITGTTATADWQDGPISDGAGLFKTLRTIVKDNWEWRGQIGRLAIFELVKRSRGAVLGWAWLFIKPMLYITVFWFALEVGLRAGANVSPPYFLWLVTGLIPWFYMADMLGIGADVLNRYPDLVNKIRFPQSSITTIFNLSSMIIELGLMVVLLAIYFLYGMPLDIYLIQVPILIVLMFLFWEMFSIMASQLSAMSKDISNLFKAIITVVFWVSGVIFRVGGISIPWVRSMFYLNPVSFFVEGFRCALYDKTWFWADPLQMGGFAVVFIATLVVMLLVYRRFNEEVADVI